MRFPILIKLNRLSAWLLLGLVIVYFLTGFDMVKNFWKPDLSRYVHSKILPLPVIILFFLHSVIGLRFFLLRNQFENKPLRILLYLSGFLVFFLFLYLFFR